MWDNLLNVARGILFRLADSDSEVGCSGTVPGGRGCGGASSPLWSILVPPLFGFRNRSVSQFVMNSELCSGTGEAFLFVFLD